MARRDPVGIRLITRRGNDWSHRYPLVVEAVNHLKVRSCLIDGEVVCCDERGLATFQLLRHRRNEPQAFLYAFDLLELNGDGPAAGADRGAQGDAGQHPAQEPAGCAPERAPGAPGGRRRVPARLQDGAGGDRLEAAGIALPIGPVAGLAQVQEPGGACGEAGGGRGLGEITLGRSLVASFFANRLLGELSRLRSSASRASLVHVRAMSSRMSRTRGLEARSANH